MSATGLDSNQLLIEAVCVVAFIAASFAFIQDQSATEPQGLLRLIATIAMPNVAGRIDHLALDPARQRLFVAALGNNSVEVIDLSRNVHLRSLPGFHEPQGIAILSDLNAVAVANGDSGTLQLLDAATLQTRWTVTVGGDADNVRYDIGAKRVFVAFQGGIAAVDPTSARIVQRIRISGHPESFQLESHGPRLFANLPDASAVIAADRSTAAVADRWVTGACQANYPMALDEAAHRLFVGCRRPASLALFDTTTGKSLNAISVVGDTDDVFYDNVRGRVYVIGGEGFIDVIQREGDALRRVARVPTRDGARTATWAADPGRLYLAVPSRSGRTAEVRVFAASD